MAGVAFAVEGDGLGFATESYAASALYTTLASLSDGLGCCLLKPRRRHPCRFFSNGSRYLFEDYRQVAATDREISSSF
jgi:hypothetical protein